MEWLKSLDMKGVNELRIRIRDGLGSQYGTICNAELRGMLWLLKDIEELLEGDR